MIQFIRKVVRTSTSDYLNPEPAHVQLLPSLLYKASVIYLACPRTFLGLPKELKEKQIMKDIFSYKH